jgi:3-phenylpropionate/trans-cinnamate dioxygenase ferredoxin component
VEGGLPHLGGGGGGLTRDIDVGAVEDLPDGTMQMIQVDGVDILLLNLHGRVHAMQGICSHEYFELDKGFLTNGSITCALHLSRFDLDTGEPLDPPAELPLVTFPVYQHGDEIILEIPEGEIPINE